ncbi:MAG: DUF2807 domain-containing protein [Bacteroidota bacterium]
MFIIGFGLIVFLSILWILSIIGFFYAFPFTSYFFGGSQMMSLITVTNVMVLVGVPLLTIIFYCIRFIFKTQLTPQFRSGMWSFWAVNLVSFLLITNFVWREFNQRTGQEIAVTQLSTNVDTIRVNLSKNASDDVLNRIGNLLVVGDEMLSEDVELHIRPSESDNFELTQWNYARGRDRHESDGLIKQINYPIKVENNLLTLPASFSIPAGTKWRGQRVRVTLKVPQGKMVDLDRNLQHIDVWMEKDDQVKQPWHVEGLVWEMQEEGMVCPDYLAETNFQKNWPESDFNKLQIEGKIIVNINKGQQFAVLVKGEQEKAEKVEIFKVGKTLNVAADFPRHYRGHHREEVVLNITMPSLKELDVEKTGNVEVRGFKEKEMAIRHQGYKSIKAFIDVDSLTIRQEGHNTMDISGAGRFLAADVSEGSKLNTERFPVMVADLKASDRGYVKANVRQLLHREVDGRSRVEVEGDPKIHKENAEELEDNEEDSQRMR